MDCDDLVIHTAEFMNAYDINADGTINLGDYHENTTLELMTEVCDSNYDG
jgi:hypothetical protein